MAEQTLELQKFEKKWKDSEKILIRERLTKEAFDFLEEKALQDFGKMKRGALGMELTKLILIAKESLEKKS